MDTSQTASSGHIESEGLGSKRETMLGRAVTGVRNLLAVSYKMNFLF